MIASILLVFSLESSATILSGTAWTEVGSDQAQEEIECPIRFEFVGTKYRYINECTGQGKNKVVEFGEYIVGSDSLILTHRMVIVGKGSILGEDAKQITFKLRQYQQDSMTIAFGETVLTFESSDPVEW